MGTEEAHPLYNEVVDNHIHHCGVFNKYVAGVFLGLSTGNVVAHNLIEYLPHHAINLGNSGFGRNIVEYNKIRHVTLEAYDTAAINCWMELQEGREYAPDPQKTGHVIRYNFIADVAGCEVDSKGKFIFGTQNAFGIYLDNFTSNCFVYGNIIVRTGGRRSLFAAQVTSSKTTYLWIAAGCTPPMAVARLQTAVFAEIFSSTAQVMQLLLGRTRLSRFCIPCVRIMTGGFRCLTRIYSLTPKAARLCVNSGVRPKELL